MRKSPAKGSVQDRARATAIAHSDPPRAFAIARAIPDAWYRCQALAKVARAAGGTLSERAFKQAVDAAYACDDAYGTVAVMAWPLRAAIERGQLAVAPKEFARVLALVPEVEPTPSRAYALWTLWQGCFPGGAQFRQPILRAIPENCPPDRSWRCAALYRDVIGTLEQEHPGAGAQLLAAMPDGKARRRLERTGGRKMLVRSFF